MAKYFMQEAKLDQSLKEFQQHLNAQKMKYIRYKKAILKVQNFLYNVIQKVFQLETKNICEQLQGDITQRAQIVAELKDQIESLEKVLNQSSESRQHHDERINMLNQIQLKYEMNKQKIQAYKQVESEDYNESELTLNLSETCFNAIYFVQEKAKCQILEAQDISDLIALFLFQKEQYDYQLISSENVESFVKKFSQQVISKTNLRGNPLNKSNICQILNVCEQLKHFSNQKIIKKFNEVIELSKTSLEIEQASSNAITILKNLNPNFVQKNFEGISIKEADLRDAIFQDCSFKNVNPQEANLINAKLVNCNLNGANLTNAILEQSQALDTFNQFQLKKFLDWKLLPLRRPNALFLRNNGDISLYSRHICQGALSL